MFVITLAIISPVTIAVIVLVVLLLFGAERLPKLARSAGKAKKEFLKGQAESDEATTHQKSE
jgi:TatA/E family protein of Tat protein translocase